MIYYRITGGKFTGYVGRIVEVMGNQIVFLIQTRDQWVLSHQKAGTFKRIKRWGLLLANETNYVEELL